MHVGKKKGVAFKMKETKEMNERGRRTRYRGQLPSAFGPHAMLLQLAVISRLFHLLSDKAEPTPAIHAQLNAPGRAKVSVRLSCSTMTCSLVPLSGTAAACIMGVCHAPPPAQCTTHRHTTITARWAPLCFVGQCAASLNYELQHSQPHKYTPWCIDAQPARGKTWNKQYT